MSNIQGDKVIKISEVGGEPLYIYDIADSQFQKYTVKQSSGITLSQAQPLQNLSAHQVKFEIQQGAFGVNQFKSYLEYVGEFQYKFYTQGKYFYKGGLLYFQEAAIELDTHSFNYINKKPQAVSMGPMNSMCILDKTEVRHGNTNIVEENVYKTRTVLQSSLSSQHQNSNSDTWFDSGDEQLVVEWIPYTEATPGTKVYYTMKNFIGPGTEKVGEVNTPVVGPCGIVPPATQAETVLLHTYDKRIVDGLISYNSVTANYVSLTGHQSDFSGKNFIRIKTTKVFKIPMSLINHAFQHEHLEYVNALKNSGLFIELTLCNTTFSYLFDHSNSLFIDSGVNNNVYRSGLISNKLVLFTHKTKQFLSDTQNTKFIQHRIQRNIFQQMEQLAVDTQVNKLLSLTQPSVNSISVLLNLPENEIYTKYIQQFSLLPIEAILLKANGVLPDDFDIVFPREFNISRSGSNLDNIFVENVNDLQSFKQEIVRYHGYNDIRNTALAYSFKDNEWLTKYSMITVDCQQWANELGVNPIMDGITTFRDSNKVYITFKMGHYDTNSLNSVDYATTNTNIKYQITYFKSLCLCQVDSIINVDVENGFYKLDDKLETI